MVVVMVVRGREVGKDGCWGAGMRGLMRDARAGLATLVPQQTLAAHDLPALHAGSHS